MSLDAGSAAHRIPAGDIIAWKSGDLDQSEGKRVIADRITAILIASRPAWWRLGALGGSREDDGAVAPTGRQGRVSRSTPTARNARTRRPDITGMCSTSRMTMGWAPSKPRLSAEDAVLV